MYYQRYVHIIIILLRRVCFIICNQLGFPCRQAVSTSTTLPTPAVQGKCSTVFPLYYHWPALHFYEVQYKGTLILHLFCSTSSTLPLQYLECSGSPKTAHFQCWIRPKEGDAQASAKEAGNKPILSAALPLRCLPTWVMTYWYYND